MSFLDNLREARTSPSAAYQQFALNYPKTSDDVHAFLEGRNDPSFYLSFLVRVKADLKKIHVYKCKNKKGVYASYSKVMHLVNKPSFVLFFADKDHSDLIGEVYETAPNIFVTEYYSIDNYLVTDDMLRRIWEEFFDISQFLTDFETIETKFQTELRNFYDLLLPISAWIILIRRKGLRPCLDNVKLNELCNINSELSLETNLKLDLFEKMESFCDIPPQGDLSIEIKNIIKELDKIEPKKYVRGKYELWFFIKFVEKLREILQVTNNSPVKIHTTIGESNAVEILGPRVKMPDSLIRFFNENGLVINVN